MNYFRYLFLLMALSFINCEAKSVVPAETRMNDKEPIKKKEIDLKTARITSDSLSFLIRSSLSIGTIIDDRYEIDVTKEKLLVSKITSELKKGAILKKTDIFQIVERDGSGENQITSEKILKILVDNYKSGSKKELLDTLLLKSILTTNASIVAYLISNGANPKHEDITAQMQLISPDYSPDYKMLKLLVEKLQYDLYKNCDVTLIWWLVLENQATSNPDLKAIQKEIKENPKSVFFKCNSNSKAPFFDADLFPTNKTAYDLGISSENVAVKNSFKILKNK